MEVGAFILVNSRAAFNDTYVVTVIETQNYARIQSWWQHEVVYMFEKSPSAAKIFLSLRISLHIEVY